MSRVGKLPVAIPNGVTIELDGNTVKAKGAKGELSFTANDNVKVEQGEEGITVTPIDDSRQARANWGTCRARINNLVIGVSQGYTKELELVGVGYRAAMKGSDLQLQLGYSHDVIMQLPAGITVTVEKPTSIKIEGPDKQVVGQFAANVREWRLPEPYKGKGIKYVDEYIYRKEGKKK